MLTTKTTKDLLLAYFSYLILFLGTGFISGAIVHSGNIKDIPKYLVIGIIGVALFIAGSFVQEYIVNKDTSKSNNRFQFFVFSLLLSLGIGMISGGTQHFTDFPSYSSILIPLGLVVSFFAFVFKNNFNFSKNIAIIGGIITLLALPFFAGLNSYANFLVAQSNINNCQIKVDFDLVNLKVLASGDHVETTIATCPTPKTISNTMSKNTDLMAQMDHGSMSKNNTVVDDKSFIEYVIPHHQDAVDGSQALLATTQDNELKLFLNNVIRTQSEEITILKGYYKQWFGKEYIDNGSYTKMMKVTKTGVSADKEYVQGMLGHHSGIIDIANKILVDSKSQYKPQILEFSRKVIKDQEADNVILNKWLVQKYKQNHTTMKEKTMEDGHSHAH